MSFKKIINSTNPPYEDQLASELVFDVTPTKGSFNVVTSDGVARAIESGGGGGCGTTYTAGTGIEIDEND